MIVADCSAVVHIFTAASLDENLVNRFSQDEIHAPHLLDVEVMHALRGLLTGQKISIDRAEHARRLYAQLPIKRYPMNALAERIWSLRHNLTAYDAAYVALAEVLGCPLVTRDTKLMGAGHGAQIEIYSAGV